jgi:biotin carboxyl carrier protein
MSGTGVTEADTTAARSRKTNARQYKLDSVAGSTREPQAAAVELRLASLSVGMEYATVLDWRKRAGDHVDAGEPIVEVEAEKVNYEILAPVAGTLAEIVASENEEVAVGGLLAVIDPV